MANAPAFAATPHAAAAITNAALDTSLTAPTNVATVFTAGANGSRIDTVRIIQVASSANAGYLNLFLFDGTTYHLLDAVAYALVTLSTTSEQAANEIPYNSLVFQTGWSLRATVTTTGGQSAFKVLALGGDF